MRVPVVANGDIGSPRQAREVLAATGADAVMIGRAAQGRPWIFREVVHFLATGAELAPPLVAEVQRALLGHLHDHYALYGEYTGVRSARKHIGWYVRALPGGEAFRTRMNDIEDSAGQLAAVTELPHAGFERRMPCRSPGGAAHGRRCACRGPGTRAVPVVRSGAPPVRAC